MMTDDGLSARGTCPICRDTGIAHRAPYMMGLPDGDLYTITACTCPAGKTAFAGQ